jgi:hypothetical protein
MSTTKQSITKKFNDLIMFSMQRIFDQSKAIIIFTKLVQLKLAVTPDYLIKNLGPFVYAYKEHIDNKNIDFFINHDYKDQMEDWRRLAHGHAMSILNDFRESTTNSLRKQRDKNPKMINQVGAGLLQTYCEYILEERRSLPNSAQK